jgi:hypothetical protein
MRAVLFIASLIVVVSAFGQKASPLNIARSIDSLLSVQIRSVPDSNIKVFSKKIYDEDSVRIIGKIAFLHDSVSDRLFMARLYLETQYVERPIVYDLYFFLNDSLVKASVSEWPMNIYYRGKEIFMEIHPKEEATNVIVADNFWRAKLDDHLLMARRLLAIFNNRSR